MKTKATAVHFESGPNMTPLVDVVMVILIFLMLAGSFGGAEHFLAGSTPVGTGPGPVDSNLVALNEPVSIRIDTSNGHFLARGNAINATDPETLYLQLNSLRQRMNAAGRKTSDLQIRIEPGRNAKYEHVIAVQEAAMKASFEKIGFASAH